MYLFKRTQLDLVGKCRNFTTIAQLGSSQNSRSKLLLGCFIYFSQTNVSRYCKMVMCYTVRFVTSPFIIKPRGWNSHLENSTRYRKKVAFKVVESPEFSTKKYTDKFWAKYHEKSSRLRVKSMRERTKITHI